MKPEERHQLIDALVEGEISEADFVRLEAELLVDAEARREYYDRVQLDSLIDVEIRARKSESTTAGKVINFPRPARSTWALGIAAAVAILLSTSALSWWAGRSNIAPVAEAEPVAVGVGVIAEHVDAKWAGNSPSIRRGELLPQGILALESGTVQIDLFSGVGLIVDGRAEFELLSPMEMRVLAGKIRARVPEQARGFRVHTAAGEVVDLGTEFALDVGEERTEVHVIDGEIEWHPEGADMLAMAKGDAVQISGSSRNIESIAHDPARFADIGEIEATLARSRAERRKNWQAHSARLADDPHLLLYYPLDRNTGNSQQLVDAGPNAISGTVVRADRVSDRWGVAHSALDFTPAGSRVRVDVPGEHRSLTFYCWARIDSLDRWYNSLFLTDGHEINEPHWQILKDGRLFFSVKKNASVKSSKSRDKYIFHSPSIWTPAQAGQWFQIATTYDVDARQVRHYLNGEAISSESIDEQWLVETVSIGSASIGNWSEPRYRRDDPSFAIRNLNGVIDEFAIFGAALSEAEIRELYEIGKP